MKFLMICDLLCFPGVIWFLMKMKKKGTLNDKRWGLIVVSYFQLTAIVFYNDGTSPMELTIASVLGFVGISLILWVISYPFARWVYREMVEEKSK
jgi:riboflavin transporter FmnP